MFCFTKSLCAHGAMITNGDYEIDYRRPFPPVIPFDDRVPHFISKNCMWQLSETAETAGSSVEWKQIKPGHEIVGRLETEQLSCPCCYINAVELDVNGDPIRCYQEETRSMSYVVFMFRTAKGEWFRVEYENGKLQDTLPRKCTLCEIKDLQESIRASNGHLEIDDPCRLTSDSVYSVVALEKLTELLHSRGDEGIELIELRQSIFGVASDN